MKLPPGVTIVIFGGGGDLAHRKLLPALYNLHVDHLLPPKIAIVGVGRKDQSDGDYRAFAKDGVKQFSRRPIDEEAWKTFAAALFLVNMSLDDEHGFAKLGARLDTVEHERGLTGDRIYYLAVPPALFAPTVKELARARFVERTGLTNRCSSE
jgi:glucose-6-phosphate 1-dehydrogenase